MNDLSPVGFFRRLGAFLIDAAVVFVLAVMGFTIWAIVTLGGPPETTAEIAAVIDAGQESVPSFYAWATLGYLLLTWSPLIGRRSVGMRQFDIRVIRDR